MEYNTLIIDGPYLAHRSYAAPYQLTTKNGVSATMIHSFIRSLYSFYKKFKPYQVIVTWESHGSPSWRREMYTAYKPKESIDMTYVTQVNDLKDLLYLLDIVQFKSDTNEADDVIATLVNNIEETGMSKNILIYTKDKDIMQLATNTCHIFDGKNIITPQHVIEKFGILPKQIPDFLAIMGDSSDNIVGLSGYGNKRTSKLLMEHNQIESIPNTIFDDEKMELIKRNKKLTLLNRKCGLIKIPENQPSLTAEGILDKYELTKMKKDIEQYRQLGESWEV